MRNNVSVAAEMLPCAISFYARRGRCLLNNVVCPLKIYVNLFI